MQTECSAERFDFGIVGDRQVIAFFDAMPEVNATALARAASLPWG
jgi:hypothetical protein